MKGHLGDQTSFSIVVELIIAGARAHNLLSEALHDDTLSSGLALPRAVRYGVLGPRVAKRLARLAQWVDAVRHTTPLGLRTLMGDLEAVIWAGPQALPPDSKQDGDGEGDDGGFS